MYMEIILCVIGIIIGAAVIVVIGGICGWLLSALSNVFGWLIDGCCGCVMFIVAAAFIIMALLGLLIV